MKENKNIKVLMIIIVSILIVYAIIVGIRIYTKMNLNNKAISYFNNENYYMKQITYSKDGIMIGEKYYKDGKSLTNIVHYNYDEKTESISYKDEKETLTVFKENGEVKRVEDYENGIEPITHYALNLPSEIFESIFKGLQEGYCDDRECYIFNNKKDGNTYYIDKETGLALRVVNNKSQYIINEYKYEFNNVKDEEVKKPDFEENS